MSFFSGFACDECGVRHGLFGVYAASQLTAIARRGGWTVGKQHLCPKCRKKENAPAPATNKDERKEN